MTRHRSSSLIRMESLFTIENYLGNITSVTLVQEGGSR
jgi:hypothetical protein